MSNTDTDALASSQRASKVASFKVMDVLQRANELQAAGHEVLHAEVGQPQSGAPRIVNQAAIDALQNPSDNLGYTDAFGLLKLRQKVSEHYQRKYPTQETDVPAERIVITTGSSGGFLLAFTACFDVGDVVAIASSGYPCYRNILSALGCRLVHVPLNEEFKLTAQELRKSMAKCPKINGLVLSSPSNPTGAMLTPAELHELCDFCDEQHIQFISDEIYHGISYGKAEATALQYSSKALIINSFSKYYCMSGWRLGWMVLPEHLVIPINKLQQNMFINAPTISQTAAMHCWDKEAITELEGHVQKYRTSREIILNELEHLPLRLAPADGGFYVYVDLGEDNRAPGMGSVALCTALLEEHFVAFTPGIDFEDPASRLGDRRFRISYAGGIETVRKAMQKFTNFWPSWMERVRAAQAAS